MSILEQMALAAIFFFLGGRFLFTEINESDSREIVFHETVNKTALAEQLLIVGETLCFMCFRIF